MTEAPDTTEENVKPKSKTPAKTKSGKPRKPRRSEEERIAALQQQIADTRARAEAKAGKQVTTLHDKRDKLVARIEKLNAQIAEVDGEIEKLEGDAPS